MTNHQPAPTAFICENEGKRIPLSLQAVFLNGNRGKEIHTPPPDASAMKEFSRSNARGSGRWRPFRSWSSRTAADARRKSAVEVAAPVQVEVTEKPAPVRKVRRTKSTPEPSLSPQDYLEGLLHSRGYCATKYSTLLSAYYNKPTPLQIASYGVYMVDMIREGNVDAVKEILKLGLSSNASNVHGESIVHNVCRRADAEMLEILLQAGCEIQVSDDNGRTPLHDACWAQEPNFVLIEKLLVRDKQMLLMMDSRGHLPLSYIRKHHWSEWLQFLQSKKDDYWPRGGGSSSSNELVRSEPNSRPIPDPDDTLTLSLTQMVAAGKLKPKEARFMQNEFENKPNVSSLCKDENDDDDDSECSEDSDSGDDESVVTVSFSETNAKQELDESWNLEEMNNVLNSLTKPNRAPLAW